MISLEIFKQDKELYNAIAGIELEELKPQADYFNYLLRSVTFQQLSGKAGATIHGRLLDLFGGKMPTPADVLSVEPETLRGVGLSGQKAGYIKNIAAFWEREQLDNTRLDNMPDEDLIKYLTSIKGVGQWTVEMLLMFGMGRPDLFPLDDLGIQQGICLLYDIDFGDKKKLRREMITRSEKWKPHRSLAARYIWAWKDLPENKLKKG